jgi:hypothetical protein
MVVAVLMSLWPTREDEKAASPHPLPHRGGEEKGEGEAFSERGLVA